MGTHRHCESPCTHWEKFNWIFYAWRGYGELWTLQNFYHFTSLRINYHFRRRENLVALKRRLDVGLNNQLFPSLDDQRVVAVWSADKAVVFEVGALLFDFLPMSFHPVATFPPEHDVEISDGKILIQQQLADPVNFRRFRLQVVVEIAEAHLSGNPVIERVGPIFMKWTEPKFFTHFLSRCRSCRFLLWSCQARWTTWC